MSKGERIEVMGIPRFSVSLIDWRMRHKDDPREPLKRGLPYELIAVAALKGTCDGSELDLDDRSANVGAVSQRQRPQQSNPCVAACVGVGPRSLSSHAGPLWESGRQSNRRKRTAPTKMAPRRTPTTFRRVGSLRAATADVATLRYAARSFLAVLLKWTCCCSLPAYCSPLGSC